VGTQSLTFSHLAATSPVLWARRLANLTQLPAIDSAAHQREYGNERRMKFSISINMNWSPDRVRRQVIGRVCELMPLAEDRGFEIAWAMDDHTIELGRIHSLSWWTSATPSRIRLGTAVVVARYRHAEASRLVPPQGMHFALWPIRFRIKSSSLWRRRSQHSGIN
jgi:hypothetical protein